MGRMLDVLRLADVRRDGAEEEHFVSDSVNEEVPFIEVGAGGGLEASSSVLAAPPRLRLAPRPPADAGPILDPNAGAAPAPFGVRLSPLPGGLGLLPPHRFAAELIAFHQPDHPAGAEYRQVASALRQPDSQASQPRVVFCAGADRRAGTTGVVLNLAVCLAGDGLRVVVVDAAEARPAVADRLGLRPRPGLAEVLDGSESLDRALQETGLPRLTVLPAGRSERERLPSAVGEVCRPVLRLLRDRFDLVLIDGGTDELGLAAACDAAYLVTRHDRADAPETTERARALLGQGAPLRACLVTGH
ncbi:MAG TPA: hypothetical protein VFW33_10115 [Gemmataceae bacterium]|nr:hypothetical protein [Gemmataceae bacterium]